MPQPTPYDRQANFSNFEAVNPTEPKPGASLDAEFNAVKITSDQILSNLAMIQRDDGALANEIVTSDSLHPSLSIGFTLRGPWAAPENYLLADGVTYDNAFWRCEVSHLSEISDPPDDADPKWTKVVDFNDFAPAVIPDNSVTPEKLTDAELKAIAALTSAANKLPYFTGAGTAGLTDLTLAARTFLATTTAANVPSTPAGNIAATNVQAALAELDGEKAKLAGGNSLGGMQFVNTSAGTGGQVIINDTGVAVNSPEFGRPPLQSIGKSGAYAASLLGTDGASAPYLVFYLTTTGPSGSITGNGATGVLYNTTSDYRLKLDPQDLTDSGAFIDALRPRSWTWAAGGEGVGFIAHEVQEVSPASVSGDKDAETAEGKPIYQAMQASSPEIMAHIVAELKSLRARVAALEGA